MSSLPTQVRPAAHRFVVPILTSLLAALVAVVLPLLQPVPAGPALPAGRVAMAAPAAHAQSLHLPGAPPPPVAAAILAVDATPPTLHRLTINGGALASTSRAVALGLVASDLDGGSGLTDMSFSNDGGATWSIWQPFAPAVPWTLAPGDGPKRVQARVRDAASNISTAASAEIALDTAAGTASSVTIERGAAWTAARTVTLRIGAPPGTAQMQVSEDPQLGGAAWEPYAATRRWELHGAGAAGGVHTVYVRFLQANSAATSGPPASDSIGLDVTPPTGTIENRTIFAGGAGAHASARAPASPITDATWIGLLWIGLNATDDLSGIHSARLSNRADFAGASWQPYQTTDLAWVFDANRRVYAQFRDRAGNVSATVSLEMPTGWCWPRPPVIVEARPRDGALEVTVRVTEAYNRLAALRFARLGNAVVEIDAQRQEVEPFTLAFPAQPVSHQFTVRRQAPGAATTVRLVVIDGCGEWSTFVGGGPGAF